MHRRIKTAHIKEWDRLRPVPLFLFWHDYVTKLALSRHRGGASFFVFWGCKEAMNLGRWIPYNPNPQGKSVGDCAIRACTVATSKDWDAVYMELTLEGFARCDLISANHVWGRYLKRHGYTREFVRDDCETCYTVDDFCKEHPKGTFILALTGHVVAVQDGNYLDSWDSGKEVPIYYWHKKEDD